MFRYLVTLRISTNMVEEYMRGLLALTDATIETISMVVWPFVLCGIGYLLWVYYIEPTIKVERIRLLLHCKPDEAKQVHDYLLEIGVDWMTFHKWVWHAKGRLMPLVMINDPDQNRLIATWQESRWAILKLSLEKRLKPEWTKQDALGAIGLEIIKQRQSEGLNVFDPYD